MYFKFVYSNYLKICNICKTYMPFPVCQAPGFFILKTAKNIVSESTSLKVINLGAPRVHHGLNYS